MKAIFKEATDKQQWVNGCNRDGEKERVSSLQALVTMPDGTIREVISARFYMSRKSDGAAPLYCSVWLHFPAHPGNARVTPHGGLHRAGNAKASGYGYHKESQALYSALTDEKTGAGVYFTGSPYSVTDWQGKPIQGERLKIDKAKIRKGEKAYFGGCGDDSSREALRAICKALGFSKVTII